MATAAIVASVGAVGAVNAVARVPAESDDARNAPAHRALDATSAQEPGREPLVIDAYDWTCRDGSLMVTNLGDAAAASSRPVLLAFAVDDEGTPVRAECPLPVAGGATARVPLALLPAEGRVVAYSFTQRTMAEIGADPENHDPVADWVCEQLFFSVIRNADAYAAFDAAYRAGGTWKGLDMTAAYGDPLAFAEPEATCRAWMPFGWRPR